MSSGTNQERIEQNNLKLAQLKTKADNLPEYQDVEPIYGVEQLVENKTNLAYNSNNNYIEYMGDYIGVHNPMNSKRYTIYKVNTDNSVTQLYSVSGTNDFLYTHLIDYDDEYVYFYQNNSFSIVDNIIIYRIPISGGTASNYWSPTVSRGGTSSFGVIKKGQIIWSNYVYNIDCTNKTLSKTGTYLEYSPTDFSSFKYSSCILFNYNMVYNFNNSGVGTKLIRIDTGITRTLDIQNINAVLYDNSRIVIGNNLYYLNEDLTTGELIKENVIDGYVDNMMLSYIYETYYLSLKDGKIYFFNIDTNTFELYKTITILSATNSPLRTRVYIANSYYYLISSELSSDIIGYNCYGQNIYLPAYSFGNNNHLLSGDVLYNKFGTVISGTMPNNGELNYTPSTSQQTIPAGYTSGGTVAAVSMTEQEIEQAETLATDILS